MGGRTVKALTMAQIRRLPRGYHAVGGGLVVQVTATDRRWKLRRYIEWTQRMFDLGSLDDLSPEAAHEAAAAIVSMLLKEKAKPPAPAKPRAIEAAANDENPFVGPIARALMADL